MTQKNKCTVTNSIRYTIKFPEQKKKKKKKKESPGGIELGTLKRKKNIVAAITP